MGVASHVDGGELVDFLGAPRRFWEESECKVGCGKALGQSVPRAQGPDGLTRVADVAGAEEEEVENGENEC